MGYSKAVSRTKLDILFILLQFLYRLIFFKTFYVLFDIATQGKETESCIIKSYASAY